MRFSDEDDDDDDDDDDDVGVGGNGRPIMLLGRFFGAAGRLLGRAGGREGGGGGGGCEPGIRRAMFTGRPPVV